MKFLTSKRIIALLLCLVMVMASASEVFAATNSTKAKTLRLTKYEGSVTIKNASGKTQKTKSDMKLYSGYTVRTAKDGIAYISLDDKKAIKLDSLTEVEVRKSGKKLEVYLSEGNLFFNVSDKLSSDETLNIRTNTMVTGIRGTSGNMKAQNNVSELVLTDGIVEAKSIYDNQTIEVEAGEILTTTVSTEESEEQTESEEGKETEEGTQQEQKEEQKEETNVNMEVKKVENLMEVLPAFAAEEIANDSQLSERVAENFNVKAEELVQQIQEALPEMKAQETKQHEEQAAQDEKTESFDNYVDQLGEAEVTSQPVQEVVDYGYVEPTPTPTPTPDPVVKTYTVTLPDSVENVITISPSGVNTVSENAIFSFTIECINGITVDHVTGASIVGDVQENETTTTYSYNTTSITTDTAVEISVELSDNTKAYKETIESNGIDVIDTQDIGPTGNSTYVVSLPASINDLVTFTPIGETEIESGSTFSFYVKTANGISMILNGATSTGEKSDNGIVYKTDSITTTTAITISAAAITQIGIGQLNTIFRDANIPELIINDTGVNEITVDAINVPANKVLTIASGTTVSASSITNDGTLNVIGTLYSGINNNSGGVLNISNTASYFATNYSITNDGIININGYFYVNPQFAAQNPTLSNNGQANFKINKTGNVILGCTVTNDGTFDNDGSLSITKEFINNSNGTFINNGEITVGTNLGQNTAVLKICSTVTNGTTNTAAAINNYGKIISGNTSAKICNNALINDYGILDINDNTAFIFLQENGAYSKYSQNGTLIIKITYKDMETIQDQINYLKEHIYIRKHER